jgi:UPF0271 protein
MRTIDINCDMGESFGAYRMGEDEAVMPFITSANIACGFHAGDPVVMQATVRLAVKHGVSIGAHPGYPDLQGFGRREMRLAPEEVEALVLYQVSALAGFARAEGAEVSHVKPHGALYNQAARDTALAGAIARAARRFSREVILVGLAGSRLIEAGLEAGLGVAREAFPDRAYESDGSLRQRELPGAVIDDPKESAANGLRLAREGVSITRDGSTEMVAVDTLCVHGDTPGAAARAKVIHEAIAGANIRMSGINKPNPGEVRKLKW